MSKYSPLEEFLKAQRTSEVPMSFAEIERIIDAKLPMSALQYQAWWSNDPTGHVNAQAWLAAGFRTEQVDIGSRKVVFRKYERHPIFGALKDTTFIPPGVDLTEPADPDWGKVYDD